MFATVASIRLCAERSCTGSSIGFMCIYWSQAHTAHQLVRFAASKDAHSQIRLILTLADPIRGAWIGCSLNESHVSTPNLYDEADARASAWTLMYSGSLYYTLAICLFYFLPLLDISLEAYSLSIPSSNESHSVVSEYVAEWNIVSVH